MIANDVMLGNYRLAEYPLTPMQRGMLFDHLASETPEIDVLQIVGTLDESLDVPTFRRAWELTVGRHSALRTHFRWQGLEDSIRIVDPGARISLELLDESDTPLDQRREKVQQLMDAERARGFDLSRPPLARLALVGFGPGSYTLILTVHHILMDAVSFPVLIRELFAIHEALSFGASVSLPPIPADDSHPGASAARDGSATGVFWRTLLEGFTTPTPLPSIVERGRRDERGTRRGEVATRLSEESTDELRRLASSMDVTLNTVVQTAWGLLLSRYSGEDDVVFGSVRRVQAPGEVSPVGLYLNTLPLRVQMASSTTLAELLRHVRNQHVASRPYKQTPLVEIRRCSKVPGPTGLFDTFVVFNRESLGRILHSQGGNWARREFRLAESLSSFSLGLYAYADPCLQLKLVYDRSRLDDAAVARVVEHVALVLAAMADRVHDAATNVPMLTAVETRLLAEWNSTRRRDLDPLCIHEIIEQRVRVSPDAVALISSAGEVTYAELDRWADALACSLQRKGVGPEELVAIYLPRSLEMVVSVLATLKAGGAYLPLDPDYPKARLAYMLQDARVKVVLTEEQLAGNLPEGVPHVMHVPRGAPDGGGEALDVRPEGGVSPAHLAYVIYTSGSTGNPKGVMVEHRNVVNFFRAMDERVESASGGVWLAVTSLSFDISVLELLWTLARGFTVVIYPGGGLDRVADGRTADVFGLGDYLQRYQITHMQCTPSMALMMTMDETCRAAMGTLQQLLIGGEPFPTDLAVELRNLTSAEIINMYGPTETTIWSSTFPVSSADPGAQGGGSVVPIGRPVMNTTFHVLDRHLQRVPPGVPGELFIGGEGVARGYLHRASLTRERFIPDTYERDDRARLYRTGDLVRHGSDGCLHFLGRLDNQIKIQGHRIEPGEIEQHLQRHPGLEQAVVVAHDSARGDKHLRACVVPTRGAQPSAKELRDYLGGLLPHSMIPREFVFLDRLPLTPNKKLDRKSLAALHPSQVGFGERESPVRDGLERELARLWGEVLGLRTIGRDDNFFDLGGDSFSAVTLHFRLETVLGREFSLTDIFKFPTVRLLSDHLGRQNTADGVVRSGIDRGRARRTRHVRRDNSNKEGHS